MPMINIENFSIRANMDPETDDAQTRELTESGAKVKNSDVLENRPNRKFEIRSLFGLGLSLCAALADALFHFFGKLLKDTDTNMVVLSRSTLQFLILLPQITIKKEDVIQPKLCTNVLLIIRAVLGFVAGWSILFSMKFIPLGDAVSVHYTYVMLVGILSCVFLKEPFGLFEAVLTILTFVGLVIIIQPSFLFPQASHNYHQDEMMRVIGILFSLLSAIAAAVVLTVIRRIGTGVHYSVSLYYYSFLTTVIMLIYMIAADTLRPPCLSDVGMMVASGLTGFGAQILTTMALQVENAGTVTLVTSSQIIFTFVLQIIFLGGSTTWMSVVGAGIILFCSAALTVRKILRNA